ncbi:hypothetical protein RN001_004871 [Aquatica leii]|uniref:Uncharacterized protein n=1 Tax=Aquatica leii TaxID=1421715 RepID=A0AAN7SHN2_9COLE|nr:hypothetical protein RN001_004871 [Aquatica leii]
MDANDVMVNFISNNNHIFNYNDNADVTNIQDSELPIEAKSYIQLTGNSNTIKIKSKFLEKENTSEKLAELKHLLINWNLEELYEYFLEEQLYVSVLKCLNKEMASNLLPLKYSKGIQIIFFTNWCKWIDGTHSKELHPVSDNTECNILKSTTNTDNNQQSRVTLLKILNYSVHGRNVLEHYKKNSRITNDNVRKLLLDAIVDYYLQQKLELTTQDCDNLSNEIVNSFNGETKEYYYSHRKNSCPRGKLYNKFHNKKSFFKKTVADTLVKTNQEKATNFNTGEEEIEYVRALKYDNLTIEEIISHYNKCRNTRLSQIKACQDMKEVYASWPHYKQSYGYKLIYNDFNYLYGCHSKIYEEFDTFFEKLLPVFKEKIKDLESIKLFTQLDVQRNSLTEDGRNAGLLYLLPIILPPTTRSVVKVSDVTAWDSYIAHQNEHRSSIQPCIGIIGEHILYPKEIYVYWDNIKFRFHNILRALDVCFMIFFVFNFSYPKESEAVWQLINKYFYNIKDSDAGGVHTSVSLLFHIIKNEL